MLPSSSVPMSFPKEIVFNQKSYKFDYIFKNNNKKAYPPEMIDLIRLHYIIRLRKITTILELGIDTQL